MKHGFLNWVFLFVLIIPTLSLGKNLEQGVWETRHPAPTPRSEVAAATSHGKIYVVGGFGTFGATARLEVYDPAKDRWEVKAPLPVALHHVGIGAVDGKIYVAGGFRNVFFSWKPVHYLYEYDPDTDRWNEKNPMPTARGALTVAVLEGKLHAIGGLGKDGNVGAHEVYDPKKNRWHSLSDLPTPRDHLVSSVVNGKIYVIGGRINSSYHKNLDTHEIFDPHHSRWDKGNPLPTARSGLGAGVLGDLILIVGGEGTEGTFHENEAYHPATDTWKSLSPLPTARHGVGTAVFENNLYVIAGGDEPGGSRTNQVEVFHFK